MFINITSLDQLISCRNLHQNVMMQHKWKRTANDSFSSSLTTNSLTLPSSGVIAFQTDTIDFGEEDDTRDEGKVGSSSRRTSYYNGGNKFSKEEEKEGILKCLKSKQPLI